MSTFKIRRDDETERFVPIEEIGSDIHECRLLVFLETDPQSGKYNQVLLSPEQFKKVSDNTGEKNGNNADLKEGFEMFETRLSEEEYDLPDLQSIYYDSI